jgi:transposase, IS5 family
VINVQEIRFFAAKFVHMFRYKSDRQLSIEEFKTSIGAHFQGNNRWVKLAELLPWDALAEIYGRSFSDKLGAPSIDARVVIGALIIKHKLKLDDRGTIEMIQENPYMQYFLGLSEFRSEAVFDASLFVTIRKRLGAEAFDEMSGELVKKAGSMEKEGREKQGPKGPPTGQGPAASPSEEPSVREAQSGSGSEALTRKGTLKVDATVCDQYVKYPTDLDLTAQARKESERLIDLLCKMLNIKVKPRTYRRKARYQYLLAAKNKKLSRRKRRTAIGQQLRYLRRNLCHLDRLLDRFDGVPFLGRDYKIFLVIQHVHAQQEQMWRDNARRCDDRIVSIYQPHVRPIVRGKAGKNVEFGSKITASLVDGFARIDLLSWDAFNESRFLIPQIEAYEAEYGFWPEKVVVDNIYGTRENRQWCKEMDIPLQVKPLGRPPAQEPSPKCNKKKDLVHRNDMEGKFGEGKNGFNLNKIRAKLLKTSESWIAGVFFVMNVNEIVRRATALAWMAMVSLAHLLPICCRQTKSYAPAMMKTPAWNRTRPKINPFALSA